MYNIVECKDGSSSYTVFNIWGPGRTAKIQSDFSALMSPSQFREFVIPSLKKQCKKLDYSIYHLDGPDAVKHVDALMEIEDLDALQWTCGAGQPDGGSERWFPIYDRVRAKDKSLWIMLYDGGIKDWISSCDLLIERYGPDGMYFHYPKMDEMDAIALIEYANKKWC
jgi:5-methyltetrahydrofolate--homocysteine methyltransferase